MTKEKISNYIREISKQGKIVKKDELLKEPLSLEASKLEDILQEMSADEEFKDILKISEKDKEFFYSSEYVSDNYAELLVSLEEKNLVKTICEVVRRESKLYPRPTALNLFKLSPFKGTDEELEKTLEEIEKNKEYEDVKTVSATNGVIYLYSDLYMTKPHARGLCEWVEVEQFQNP
ncbi:hypothetical protein H3N56_01275 [Cetobacterium sp. 2A]|uniref:hypothetical protein n=1 Tax=Cetobacterium sp. 2A TaxID=2754723 RepID=UPI00163BF49E|nr:hypothetical protein [Cetobacterium sp. 2A]MBC2855125.1 hypothetical protein [Cetobacterium sp. 2A]